MNNNRNSNSNNNRRGRGRNNRNQGGNPNQQNRIDSRARGNAPQLLDKYKKLAQDAQHNGDRVQAEYYLQFADHYFRVIADNKARQDEARAKRQDDRSENSDDNDSDDDDRSVNTRRPRGRQDDQNEHFDDRQKSNGRGRDRNAGYDRNSRADEGQNAAKAGDDEQPVKREVKRPRKPRAAKPATDKGEIDIAALPPAIGEAVSEEPKPKRAPRRRKPKDEEVGGAVS